MKFPSSWSSSELEVADAYGDTLSSLKLNSKPIINTLTELANGYSKEHPKVIVHLIEERIKEVAAELKLTVLYLMDSIVKNHSDPYKKLFASNVVPTFAHVFKYSLEKARKDLFKLRLTWSGVFSTATLIELDKAVNKLDPAWPVAKPKVSSIVSHPTNIHISPAVFGRTSNVNEVDLLSAEVKRKEVELMELRKKQLEIELEAMKKKIERQKEEALPSSPPVVPVATLQESKPKILVNAKRVKDPRIRGTLPKQITDMLDKESSSAAAETSTESSRSKTPERPNVVAEKAPKSKTPTPPSPGQPESPTSTSNLPEEKKVAPPPPTIRDQLKKSPTKVSSSSKKTESRSHNTSSSSNSGGSSSKSRKRDRDREQSGSGSSHSHRDKSSRSSKRDDPSDKSPARKRDKENEEIPMTSSAPAKSSPRPATPPSVVVALASPKQQPEPEKTLSKSSSSPSPSPPPQVVPKSPASQVTSQPKQHNNRSRKIEQQKFRIPKKLSNKSRSPSPNSFKEEGPHMEFNNGRPIPKKRKDKTLHKQTDKKMKLTTDLFGDDTPSVGPKSHPAQAYSWAKFKEVNPDEYRTPIKPSQMFGDMQQYQRPDAPREPLWRGQAPGGQWRDQKDPRIQPVRNDPRQVRGGMPPINNSGGFGGRLNYAGSRFPSPLDIFGHEHDLHQPNAISDGLGHFFDRLGSTDPEVLLNQVIPVIIRQAQENMNSGHLNPNQFSSLIKKVMQLKEQAMMMQAEKMHHVRMGGASGGRKGNNMPWGGPRKQQPLPFNPADGGIPVMPPPPPPVALFAPPGGVKPRSMSPEMPPVAVANRDLPVASNEELELIASDPVSTIDIDMQPRDIRYFGELATVVMAPGDVRELSFTAGGLDPTRRIIVDDKLQIRVPVNAPNYTPFVLNGMDHRVKLGAPTRELWIDDKWYQCYFNNEIRVQIGPNFHKFFLEGPPPNVTIGKVPLTNLCLGTVQLIIDGDIDYPATIYLDLKPQCVDIAGKPHVFRFVQGLKTLLINGHPFMTQFGGTPMVVYVNQERHYLRLTTLPDGVRPDRVRLMNLDGPKGSSSPNQSYQDFGPGSPPMASNDNSQDGMDAGGLSNSFENKAFDRILSMLPSPSTPRPDKVASRRLTSQYSSSPSFGGTLKSHGSNVSSKPEPAETPTSKNKSVNVVPPSPEAPTVDIHNLWSQLLGAGLITGASAAIPGLDASAAAAAGSSSPATSSTAVKSEKEVEKADSKKLPASKPVEPVEVVKPVVMKSHDKSLKTRQSALINVLYNPSALQCKNCGLRYSPTDMIAYSQHLDWHFRMKRREKENARKAQSRTWYFERMDWINSDEIVDGEKDFTEEGETAKEDVKEEIPVVAVGSDKENKTCPICHEDFEEFYTEDNNPEKDDGGLWYYRNAVVSDSRNYHPQCLQDKTLNEGLDMSAVSEDDSHHKSNLETSAEEVSNAMDTTEHDATTEPSIKTEEVELKKEPLSPKPTTESCPSSPVAVTVKPGPEETEEEEKVVQDDSAVVTSSPSPMETDHPVKTEVEDQKEVVESTEPETDVEMKEEEASPAETAEQPKAETEDEPKPEVEGEEIKPETESEDKENSSTNLERSLDGNALSDAFVAPSKLTAASIRINLTSSIEPGKTLERRESIVSNSSDAESGSNPSENSEMDSEGIVQPPKFEAAEPKPKLVGRKLVEMPPQMKGTDTSGLCCIM